MCWQENVIDCTMYGDSAVRKFSKVNIHITGNYSGISNPKILRYLKENDLLQTEVYQPFPTVLQFGKVNKQKHLDEKSSVLY